MKCISENRLCKWQKSFCEKVHLAVDPINNMEMESRIEGNSKMKLAGFLRYESRMYYPWPPPGTVGLVGQP